MAFIAQRDTCPPLGNASDLYLIWASALAPVTRYAELKGHVIRLVNRYRPSIFDVDMIREKRIAAVCRKATEVRRWKS